MKTILVVDVCGPICMATDDGERLRDEAKAILDTGEAVCLDFTGARTVTLLFLQVVVGALHGLFPEDFLRTHLSWSALDESGNAAVEYIRDRALWFYSLPEERQVAIVEASLRPID